MVPHLVLYICHNLDPLTGALAVGTCASFLVIVDLILTIWWENEIFKKWINVPNKE